MYYCDGGSIDHAINLLIHTARDCHEKRLCKDIELNPFLKEIIPIIITDLQEKNLSETKLDFEWFVIYYVI